MAVPLGTRDSGARGKAVFHAKCAVNFVYVTLP